MEAKSSCDALAHRGGLVFTGLVHLTLGRRDRNLRPSRTTVNRGYPKVSVQTLYLFIMPTSTPILAQLQHALAIAEEIQELEDELQAVMAGTSTNGRTASPIVEKTTKRRPGRPPKSAASM